ncbi:MAG: hypothetical protein Q9210_005566 [Variospora velana]
MSSSGGSHPHNYYNNPPSIAWKVTDTDLVTLSLASAIVVLRCYTKFFLTKSRGWDDCEYSHYDLGPSPWLTRTTDTCIMALLVSAGRCADDMIARYHFGSGRSIWDIPPEYLNGYLTTIAVDGYLYLVAIVLAKLSLLIFLYHIFQVDRTFRIAAWVTGFVFVVWGIIALLMAIFACRPVRASWDLTLRRKKTTKCNPQPYDTENVYGFCNIITDFVLIIMPIPMVWNMQSGFKKKTGIILVFMTGAFVCVVAIIRQYYAYNSGQSGNPSRGIITIKIWMAIEVNVAIIVACLPALTPLFKKLPLIATLLPSIRSKFSHASAAQRAPWPQKLSGPRHDDVDVERAGGPFPPVKGYATHASWTAPRAWRDAERRAFGGHNDSMQSESRSEGSEDTGQSVQLWYHAR